MIRYQNSDVTAYVICEKCGGYYELEEKESITDFDRCQCGGTIKHVSSKDLENNSFWSDLKYAEINQKTENDKPKLICSNCIRENEEGIFCSNCGGN